MVFSLGFCFPVLCCLRVLLIVLRYAIWVYLFKSGVVYLWDCLFTCKGGGVCFQDWNFFKCGVFQRWGTFGCLFLG